MRRFLVALGFAPLLLATAAKADDVFMQAVAFALTGSDAGPVEPIIMEDCIFRAGSRTFYLNNVQTDRVWIQGWRDGFGNDSVTVELRGDTTVVEMITNDPKPGTLLKKADWTLRLDTNETERVVRAWSYVYAHGCTGKKSPF